MSMEPAEFLAAMHAAGDPGAVRLPRSRPGFLGITRHASGWVVRPLERDAADPRLFRPGLFLTTDGELCLLESSSRGHGQRQEPTYFETVGPEQPGVPVDDRLRRELEAVLRQAASPPGE